jgi:hypothetical protein
MVLWPGESALGGGLTPLGALEADRNEGGCQRVPQTWAWHPAIDASPPVGRPTAPEPSASRSSTHRVVYLDTTNDFDIH